MREREPGPWCAFVLQRNVATKMHTDCHNLFGTDVVTLSFGDFTGGEVWVECNEDQTTSPVFRCDDRGVTRCGRLLSSKERPLRLDPKVRHRTEPWEGERWTLSCYTPRGYPELSSHDRECLRALRFPLRDLPRLDGPGDQAFRVTTAGRPNKSTRKDLWRRAQRIASFLTTWCTMAASMWIQSSWPLPRGPGRPVLAEIGGCEKTLEATGLDYVTLEPVFTEDLSGPGEVETLIGAIEHFQPQTIWVHGETTYDVLGEIYPILDAQVAAGRRLILAAPEKDPCWFHPEIVQLIQKFDEKSSWKEDPNVTLDFNLMLEFNPWDNEELGSLTPGEDERDVPLLTTYVADVRERETTPNEDISSAKGASAISFAPGRGPELTSATSPEPRTPRCPRPCKAPPPGRSLSRCGCGCQADSL